ncbi:hypothetical protein SIN_1053 [Streptococcus infantis SK1302]|uniref:Uncharacterized protein n=1 Tax=Streptococcus infantis SK1302 TaxID=871237 RepID=A0ABN0B4W4_9STRE|nr:hypothetical protein SIN_1053 [Streptococcus infantis SK1302]
MTISDDFKKLINDFAIKEEIKLHEKFWCLGNLKKINFKWQRLSEKVRLRILEPMKKGTDFLY